MKRELKLVAAAAMVLVSSSTFAQTKPGDDYVQQCRNENVTLYWYGGPANCLVQTSRGNVPITAFFDATLERTKVISQAGVGSCTAQLNLLRTETQVRQVCQAVPAQPFVQVGAISYGCASQQATGEVYWTSTPGYTYTLQRSIGSIPDFYPADRYYSIGGSVSFTYRLKATDANGVSGSWSYITSTANCTGRMDD
jgi:hypothetical protein